MPEKAHREDQQSPQRNAERKPDLDSDQDGLDGARLQSDKQREPFKVHDIVLPINEAHEAGKGTTIIINWNKEPLTRGMTGYVIEGGGAVAKFTIDGVKPEAAAAFATVDAPKWHVENRKVVINPSSPPKMWPQVNEAKGAIKGHEVVDFRRTKVLVLLGFEHGVTVGMEGHIELEHGHKARYVITEATERHCRGIVEDVAIEELRKNPPVTITPPTTEQHHERP